MPTAVQTTTIKLEAKTKKRLEKLGSARRRSAHWLMKEAIQQYLDREEKRDQLHRDAGCASSWPRRMPLRPAARSERFATALDF